MSSTPNPTSILLSVNGTDYPCLLTMGAMMRFEEITGVSFRDYDHSIKHLCAFVYACAQSGARREGTTPLTLSFEDFCDFADPTQVVAAFNILNAGAADDDDGKKKVNP